MSSLGPHDSAQDAASPIPALDALPVLVIDAQATGASPKHGELLEIGWAVTTPLRSDVAVSAHWLTLSPGTRVTRVVRELTGYTEEHASHTVQPDDAWNELLEAAKTLPRTPSEAFLR